MSELIEMRKIVPVVAKVGVGKSKLLNVLYNIKFLEVKTGITTKFINLLRYNPNIKEPIFYHLKLKKEGEKYLFYPFINKDYLLSHDLCDIPGLSEYQTEIEKEIKEESKKENENENKDNDIYIKDLENTLNINNNKELENNIINNIEIKDDNPTDDDSEDDIYYKTGDIKNKTYLKEIFQIIRNYIDRAIIILSVENYYYEENFILITQLHKVIKKEITNFLIILNKMDLSSNPENDIKKLKGEIINHFPKCRTFNINLNTFIPLSVIQVENELLMSKSFRHLIFYHFYK